MSELRRDPIHGHWTIVAPERDLRPSDFGRDRDDTACPFCPGNERLSGPEVDAVRPTGSPVDEPGWLVRIVNNKYPALSMSDVADEQMMGDAASLGRARPGYGTHEILVVTPEHDRRVSNMTLDQWDTVLAAAQYRMDALMREHKLKHILLLQNCGASAGATRSHPHLQIIGMPLVPSAVAEEMLAARAHRSRHGHCLFCDLIHHEMGEEERLVLVDDVLVSFAPHASRLPFELLVLPRAHHHSFLQLPPRERRKLAAHLKELLRRLDAVLGNFAYNWFLHTGPQTSGDPDVYHWHFEILPRLLQPAGFEWGAGAYINPTTPEQAAAALRDVQL